jgi:hypothetical protein
MSEITIREAAIRFVVLSLDSKAENAGQLDRRELALEQLSRRRRHETEFKAR